MRPFFFLACLALAGSAFAQPPRAVITGPKDARCGSLVVLDASESVGTSRIWLLAVSPEETSFLPVENGLKCIFASPVSGQYKFVLAVAGTNANGGAMAEMATHTVTLTGGTPPPPPPPPPGPTVNPYPTPAAALKTATAAVTAIQMSRTDATAVAEVYDQASRLVASAEAARAAGTKPEIGTTAELRQWLIDHGRPLDLQGRYGGLADAVDAYLGKQLGTAIRPVTGDDAAGLAALAWAVWEAGR